MSLNFLIESMRPGQFYVVEAVGLHVPKGVSVDVIPPAVPLLCHAGPRPVDLLSLASFLE